MLFNSIDFALFLPLVFLLYWCVTQRNLKLQNSLIIVASYVFYGWWDWRFLFLILFSTIIDFIVGQKLRDEEQIAKRNLLLWISIIVNLGFLGFFKYYNFFTENFVTAFSFFGKQFNSKSLNVLLPVGISFYTFQTMSYTIDVYKRKLEPTNDILAFAAFVSFFPQLVAGPIERASNLLPQFFEKRNFDYNKSIDGLKQVLWGLFKKIVIADNCARFANEIFNNSTDYSGSTLVLGAIFFAFQIYGDFSGYSDIAIGISRLFGFNLMKNFDFPYFSRDIAEFWRRWHISLSTWFRDYVYIPLGGSQGRIQDRVRNVFIIFIVSGFWHGANWTFIIWGGLNALYFLPLLLAKKNRINVNQVAENRNLPSFKEFFQILFTFLLVLFAWIFFRAETLGHAMQYLSTIFSGSLFETPNFIGRKYAFLTLIIIMIFIGFEWFGRTGEYAIQNFGYRWKRKFRIGFYYSIILMILLLAGEQQEFIYFQF